MSQQPRTLKSLSSLSPTKLTQKNNTHAFQRLLSVPSLTSPPKGVSSSPDTKARPLLRHLCPPTHGSSEVPKQRACTWKHARNTGPWAQADSQGAEADPPHPTQPLAGSSAGAGAPGSRTCSPPGRRTSLQACRAGCRPWRPCRSSSRCTVQSGASGPWRPRPAQTPPEPAHPPRTHARSPGGRQGRG